MGNPDERTEETAERLTTPHMPQFHPPWLGATQLKYGAATHVGNVRSRNEDRYAITRRTRSCEVLATNVRTQDLQSQDDEAYVLVVADGVGGEVYGDQASELAVLAGWECTSRAASWLMRLDGVDPQEIQQQFHAVARSIQQAFLARCRESPHFAGMATTWTCAYLVGWDAVIAHVGDSRAYHCQQGRAVQITHDHTLAEDLRRSGMQFGRPDKLRSVLTKAFGGESEEVAPDVHQCRLREGDGVLLCSDGLSNMVTDDEIGRIVEDRTEPQEACDALVALALERGAPDNVTVVLARVELKR